MERNIETCDNLSKLKCALCDNPLSVFPILLLLGGSICGRCPMKEGSLRNKAYEYFAENKYFSCRYEKQGCSRKLLPRDVKLHEELCGARPISCPRDKCTWQGPLRCMVNHYRKIHKIFSNNSFEFEANITALQKDYVLDVLCINDKTFVLKLECHDKFHNRLSCSFKFEGIDYEIIAFDFEVVIIFGTFFDLFESKISLPQKTNKFGFVIPNEEPKAAVIKGLITIRPTSLDVKQGQTILNKLFYKCVHCGFHVQESIKFCGKILCSSCFRNEFPRISVLPNMRLTKLSDSLDNPCPQQENGCKLFEGLKMPLSHTKACDFLLSNCYLSFPACSWQGLRKDLLNHVVETHSICYNSLIIPSFFTGYMMILLDQFSFWLKLESDQTSFFLSVQVLNDTFEKFTYQFEIFHTNNNKIIIQKPCCVFDEKIQIQKTNKINNCYIRKEFLASLLGGDIEGNVTFRVEVFKRSEIQF